MHLYSGSARSTARLVGSTLRVSVRWPPAFDGDETILSCSLSRMRLYILPLFAPGPQYYAIAFCVLSAVLYTSRARVGEFSTPGRVYTYTHTRRKKRCKYSALARTLAKIDCVHARRATYYLFTKYANFCGTVGRNCREYTY